MTDPIWIATRRLTSADGDVVDISLGLPVVVSEANVTCAVRYVKNGESSIEVVSGGDAFQAIQLALGMIWQDFGESSFTWLPDMPGFTGFHRMLMFDPLMYDGKKLNKVVDDEFERQTNEFDATLEKRRQAKAAGIRLPPTPMQERTRKSAERTIGAFPKLELADDSPKPESDED